MVAPDRHARSLSLLQAHSPTPKEHGSVGCVLLESDGLIVSVTPTFAALVGYSVKTLFGQSIFAVLTTTQQTQSGGLLSEGHTIPVQSLRNQRLAQWNIHKIAPGAALDGYFIGLLYENDHLAGVEADFPKDQPSQLGSMTAVAHELAGPLNVIANNAELLLDENGIDEDARHFLAIMRDEAQRLSTLLKDLLYLNREVRVNTSAQDCVEIVQRVIELLNHQPGGKQVTLRVEAQPNLPQVAADTGRLHQVFFNLIKNAHDASPEGSEILILLRSTKLKRNQPAVEIVVSDQGKGIEPEVLDHLCTPFFSTKADGNGTGLGLSVVQQIVSAHQGEFRITSKVGKGTRASVLIPTFRSENDSNGNNYKPKLQNGH